MTAHQTLANGNQISQTEQVKLYRDAQGRTRVERTVTPPAAANQQPFTEIVITDPVAGYRYVLDSATMTAAQMPLPPARTPNPNAAAGRGANASDAVTTSLGTQTINGVLSTGTQITRTIPAGQIGNAQPIQLVRITWISNDLKIPVEVKTSDPRSGTTDLEVTNIVQSAPDASLFSVPSTYTIKTGGPGGRGPGGRPNGNFRRP
jgi:hypothetical protein